METTTTTTTTTDTRMKRANKWLLGPVGLAWFLTTCGLILAIVGLSMVQHSCSSNFGSINSSTGAANIETLTGGGGNIIPYTSCSRLYEYQWFHLAFELFVMLGVFAVLVVGMKHFRLGVIGLLAVVTVLLIEDTNTFLAVYRGARARQVGDDNLYARSVVTFVGFMVASIGNLLLIMLLGAQENTQEPYIAESGYTQNRFLRPFHKNTAPTSTMV